MMRMLLCAIAMTAMAATAAAGQLPGEDQPPPPQAVGRQKPVPTPPPAGPPVTLPTPRAPRADAPDDATPPTVLKRRGRDINVQVEVTISDQLGTGAPDKKVVSLLVADQTMGRVRANAHARQQSIGNPNMPFEMVGTVLNVDAFPTVLEGDRVLLQVTLEYAPLREQIKQPPTTLNESINVILQSGKPLVVSQAADPVSDRRMTVEVKATMVK